MSSAEHRPRLLFIVAMEQEIAPLVAAFGLKPVEPSQFLPGAPFVAWTGAAANATVHAVWCGRDPRFGNVNNVATQAAAVATYAAIAAFGAPDLLISAGTAGGFGGMGAAVGDVFLSTKCVFHSRRIPSGSEGRLEEYGFGHYRSPPLSALAAAAGLKQGVVSTSDSLDASPTDLELMRGEGTAVKEMEAAAVAWVCQALGVAFVALKAITDIVDGAHATRTEFEANLAVASERLQDKAQLVVRLLAERPLRDWTSGTGVPAAAPAAVPVPAATTTRVTAAASSGVAPWKAAATGALSGAIIAGACALFFVTRRNK